MGHPAACAASRRTSTEESGGKLKIASFIAAQLGNEQDTVQQVARGRIDMGGFSNGAVALLVPELALLGLPFYFKNVAEQDCAVDKMTKTVSDLLAKKGVKFLGWTEVGTGRHRRQEAVSGAGRRQGAEGGVGVEQGVGDDLDHARRQSNADRHHRDRLGLPDRADRRQRHGRHLLPAVGPGQGGAGAVARRAFRCARHHPHEQGDLRQAAGGREGSAREGRGDAAAPISCARRSAASRRPCATCM